MKKLFVICAVLLTACSLISARPKIKALDCINDESFTKFSTDEDLSWLEGKWELLGWQVDNHGKWEDNTKAWKYQYLKIDGKSKDSKLTQETKNSKDGKVSTSEFTVEKYFNMNNHVKGHFNKVNPEKNILVLRREFARDEKVLFYFVFTKKK